MPYSLLVNTTPEERRIALLEENHLREFFAERRYKRGLVGNLYKGRVVRVMPGMDAAFVEIGIGRPAFLQTTSTVVPFDAVPDGVATSEESDGAACLAVQDIRETSSISVGMDVIVQVTRDAYQGKGPRLSTQISLPGRWLVYLPQTPIFGVSRKIEDEAERTRLRHIAQALAPKGAGLILRTAAAGRSFSELAIDLDFLRETWQRAMELARVREAPELIYEDLDLLLRTARDLLNEGCDRVIVDTETDYDRLLQFVDSFTPELDSKIELYRGEEPIFTKYGIENIVSSLLDRVVWLPSGGSIVIDRTEAMTTIDVNTGTTGHEASQAVLKTNLEAARVIAEQIRLRNIGGIIAIDFVDMKEGEHRRLVEETLIEALKSDRAHVDVLPMSRFGVVELARSRARDGVFSRLTEPCPYCEGKGYIRSIEQICSDIVRRIAREASNPRARSIKVIANQRVIEALIDICRQSLAEIETRYRKPIRLIREDLHIESFSVKRE